MKRMHMFMGFLKALVLAIIVLESGFPPPNSWRAASAKVGCIENEREALLEFKSALGDNDGRYPWSSWGDQQHKTDCCQWEGVQCSNKTGHVLKLDLHGDFLEQPILQGKISASLTRLQYLMYFNLSYNVFEDMYMPGFLGSLTNLRYLDLRYCLLRKGNIPSQLGLLSHLRYLDLSWNFLGGSMPYQLGNLSQLRHLDLSINSLEGTIPYQLGNLSQLQYLDLANNELEGAIPYQLGNLLQLQYLNLSLNDLEATIPYQFGSLSQLRHLDLCMNFLKGSIPCQLGNLSQLQYLDLSITDLGGAIPYQLGKLSNLQKLFLSGGAFKIDQGAGVEWLSRLTSLTHLRLGYIADLKYSNEWLQMIAKLPILKELLLPGNNLSDQYILCLPSLKFNSSSFSKLDLSENKFMSSPIFHWILNISSNLVELDLGGNLLEGPIPYEFGSIMNSLENLELSYNHLKGDFESLGNISTLRSLSLGNNLLREDLSTTLQTLSGWAKYSLQLLDLSSNQITGTLVGLSTFTSLKNLDISGNLLYGRIPRDLRFPSSLMSLDIHSNSLKGVLTDSHFANMSNLKFLDLSDNSLALQFSHNWVPPFQLQAIYLRSCKLGPRFPNWLLTQNNFTQLDISNAGLSGTIPERFWGSLTPKLVVLNVSCNNISGTIPNVAIKFIQEFPVISLSSNHFNGPIPKFLHDAMALFLSNNNFSELDPFLCAHGATIIRILDLSNNQLSGQLPDCWSHFHILTFLDLSNNNLLGELPSSIQYLQNLEFLILRNNGFTGELPITLRSCSELELLDVGENKFSGHIPPWIGLGLNELEILILRNNNFSGDLPNHLCYLSRIHFLDLSLNNLSGEILQCFKNFTPMALESSSYLKADHFGLDDAKSSLQISYELSALLMWKGVERIFKNNLFLKGIDLSSNHLTGGIPIELGILVEMVSLNLSRNQLDGKIPLKIGQLMSLDLLDLSRNHFFGPIPSSLAQIDRLSVLDLSYNNLSGKIPIGTQLQSFNTSSYEGNLDLCGKPLEKKCPEEEKTQESNESSEDKQSILSKEFYWSMTFGFIIGFWGIFGSILLNRSWRHTYFVFLNNLTDTIFVLVTLNMTKCIRWLKGYLEKLG